MSKRIPITVANGDGIGPEIMAATLRILEAAEAPLEIETIDIGEKVYLAGNSSGIEPSSWDSLRRTKVFLKAPITTPQGGGFKSLNVTVRKVLGFTPTYARASPIIRFIDTKHPGDGRGDRARERRRSLRGYRAPANESGRSVFETDLPSGIGKDCSLRF